MASSSAPHVNRPMMALIVRLGAVAALATMAMMIKLVSARGVHLMEILFWRQGAALPIAIGIAMLTGGIGQLRTAYPLKHAVRGIYGIAGMLLNFSAVVMLPLAESTTLSFTAPVFAVLLSVILLKDHVGIYRWAAVILGFAGVVVIAQPGNGHLNLLGAASGLAGAFMVALISIQIADLNRKDQPLTIVFWFAVVATSFTLPFLPFVGKAHDATTWALLAGIGVFGTAGQFLLTLALRFGTVASVIVMDYSALIWATLFGWLIWDSLPPTTTWLGAPMVIGAGIVIAWRERRLQIARRAADATV